jgi:hypothetical protein
MPRKKLFVPIKNPLEAALSCLVFGLFLWFFASSLSIAYHKAPQHDDVMFASIPKNFLNGYGWATSYGEKIPFNPDISTGPTLLLPAMAMIAVFGNQTWVPAMTGALMNIALVLLILWQFRQKPHFAAKSLALLLALSLFAVNDFKTFTGYYTTALLFLLSLLWVQNPRYSLWWRFFLYGAASAVGLYGKPLILLSFLLALPAILLLEHRADLRKNIRLFVFAALGFALVFLPWQLYRHHILTQYPASYQTALELYGKQFFDNHGTGIGQLKNHAGKLVYLKLNAAKNFRLLSHFLRAENNFPLLLVLAVILLPFLLLLKKGREPRSAAPEKIPASSETVFYAVLAWVILGNGLWYVLLSFAMTPGHAFFFGFFSFFLLFFLIAVLSRSEWISCGICIAAVFLFQVRLPPLLEAYRFKVADIIDNAQIEDTLHFLQSRSFRYPLASCGYLAAPYRMEYLLPHSQNFVDCYNVLEDSLAFDASSASYRWAAEPDFTFVFEGLSLLGAAHSQEYVLGPIWESCQQHMLFQKGIYYVCEVPFSDIKDKLDPNETARHLVDYQHWYRTRIKSEN